LLFISGRKLTRGIKTINPPKKVLKPSNRLKGKVLNDSIKSNCSLGCYYYFYYLGCKRKKMDEMIIGWMLRSSLPLD
jgi:hypothetical protein